MSKMILHCGAKQVDRTFLETIPVPRATDSWVPVPHHEYLAAVLDLIAGAGFRVARESLAVADGRLSPSKIKRLGTDGASLPVPGGRFFGVLDLDTSLSDGAALAVGIRNSHDQQFAMSFVAGSRVFVCSNLAFAGELLVSRSHTRFGMDRLREAVAGAVGRLDAFRAAESRAIAAMRAADLTPRDASHLILEGYRRGITGARVLPAVLAHWDDPATGARTSIVDGKAVPVESHAIELRESFGPRNAWSLYNAHTSALCHLAATQPHKHAATTMGLRALFSDFIGAIPAVGAPEIPASRDTDEGDILD